jgi:hypothetical protein
LQEAGERLRVDDIFDFENLQVCMARKIDPEPIDSAFPPSIFKTRNFVQHVVTYKLVEKVLGQHQMLCGLYVDEQVIEDQIRICTTNTSRGIPKGRV